MTVLCGKCGSELLGAVNRCWRCGQPVVSRPDGITLPPVRRPPVAGPLEIPPWESLPAVIVEEPPPQTDEDSTGGEDPAAGVSNVRRGSPFVQGATLTKPSLPRRLWTSVREDWASASQSLVGHVKESSRKSPARMVGAYMAIMLGGGAFSLRDYPEIALAFAIFGLLLAIWSALMGSRLIAIAGMILCTLAMLWSGYGTAIALYERAYGRSPWEDEDMDSVEFEVTDP